uniref:Uncharacterized protein n=1 Tax=Spironucleus salmonicida TaxID=348837 RepID=V6LQK9_9EUKA|eukprot:EST46962.1 Hypothetical protein SS50377_12997 [Spironucleus salmonicida]
MPRCTACCCLASVRPLGITSSTKPITYRVSSSCSTGYAMPAPNSRDSASWPWCIWHTVPWATSTFSALSLALTLAQWLLVTKIFIACCGMQLSRKRRPPVVPVQEAQTSIPWRLVSQHR